MENLYTCEEVAVRYSVKTTTVWDWIKRGELPAIGIGGRYRVRASDLEAFEQKRRTVPTNRGQDNG